VIVQEQVTLTEDVPIGLWRDAVSREAFWQDMRRKLAYGVVKERPGWSLLEQREDRYALYVRRVTGPGGKSEVTECSLAEAESARLRLSCWAAEA
jgi:hypothetical protein